MAARVALLRRYSQVSLRGYELVQHGHQRLRPVAQWTSAWHGTWEMACFSGVCSCKGGSSGLAGSQASGSPDSPLRLLRLSQPMPCAAGIALPPSCKPDPGRCARRCVALDVRVACAGMIDHHAANSTVAVTLATWQVSSVVEAHSWSGACRRLQPQVPAACGECPAVHGGQHPDDIVHKLQTRITKRVPTQQHATEFSINCR